MYACAHLCRHLCVEHTSLLFSILAGATGHEILQFRDPKCRGVRVRGDIMTWIHVLVENSRVGGYLCYCAMQDEGSKHSHWGGPGNQLPLSRGSGLATRE